MSHDRRSILIALAATALASGCATRGAARPRGRADAGFREIEFATWSHDEPPYLLYPGDEIDVRTPSAPELNQTVRVGPDGRVSLPLIGSVMAADRALPELEADLSRAYASQLIRPQVEVVLRQASPLKVFVGGEVANPGAYDMPGDIDALQAVIMAGGFRPTANRREVALIRRGAAGQAMMRRVDLSDPPSDLPALRRFDILLAPRSGLAEVGAMMGLLRDALPIGFSYSLNSPYGN